MVIDIFAWNVWGNSKSSCLQKTIKFNIVHVHIIVITRELTFIRINKFQ